MAGNPTTDTLAIGVDEDELLGLHIVAALEGREAAPAELSDLAGKALRLGLAHRLEEAGLPWPPDPDSLSRARAAAEEDDGPQKTLPGRRRARWGLGAGAVLAVTFVVLIIGGYAGHWAWTGFTANNQLWDWLHLLLLPVAIGTLPLWMRYSPRMGAQRRRLMAVSVPAFAAFVTAAYVTPLVWTGFRGQTLWDWLNLFLLPIAVTSLQAWPAAGRRVRPLHLVAVATLAAGMVVTVVGGYAAGWTWTGYSGNTLWDWLQLLLAPLAIDTILVPYLVRLVSGDIERRVEAEDRQAARDKALRAARAHIAAAG